MKNAVIMAVFAYHAAMSDERIPRETISLSVKKEKRF